MFAEEDLYRLETVMKNLNKALEVYSSKENALDDDVLCRPSISWHLQICYRPLAKVAGRYSQFGEDLGNEYLADFADIVKTVVYDYRALDLAKTEKLIVEFLPQLKEKIEDILAHPEAYDYTDQTEYYPPETQIRLKQEILDYLKEIKPELEADGITRLGLYGSFAKEKAHEKSDIDICFYVSKNFKENYRGVRYFGYLGDIEDKISERFDRLVDTCDISALPEGIENRLLKGAIYV